jgi:hypothetical protein
VTRRAGNVNPPVTARARAASDAAGAHQARYRPIDIDRSPWDVFCDSFGQWGGMMAGGTETSQFARPRAVSPSQPGPPTPSPACLQDSTESPRHWASVSRRKKLLAESPVPGRHPASPSNALNSSRTVLRIVLPNAVVIHVAGDLDGDR